MESSVTLKLVCALGFSLSNLSPSKMTLMVWGKNATAKVYQISTKRKREEYQ